MIPQEQGPFGAVVRRYRVAAGLSQEALAERAELSRDAVRALERGRRSPRAGTLGALAGALGLAPAERAAFIRSALRPAAAMAPAAGSAGDGSGPASDGRAPLPVPPTPLLGRGQEVAAVCRLLHPADGAGIRLITLTGPGGVGKTRLALAVAAALRATYADGVAFVDFSALRDAGLVVSTIAQALGLRATSSQSMEEVLLAHLQAKQMLLVLDNCEQLIEAAPRVADVLGACPRLGVLVTSRTALRVRGEQQFRVLPLAVPPGSWTDDPAPLPVQDLKNHAAVQLFVARAQAVRPEFEANAATLRIVAEICTRLDGLPLAIELAAARVTVLPPAALLPRLERRLAVLTGGARDLPDRQRSLRSTLDWSYGILAAEEQRLFRQVAVFAGGCTLDAAESICGAAPDAQGSPMPVAPGGPGALPILEALAALLDTSLLQQRESGLEEPRFTMLETMREYALEHLEASGEADTVRRRHAGFFLALAEQAHRNVEGPEQVVWLQRLEVELDNLRAALGWALQQGEAEIAVRLSGALGDFWELRSHWSEGRRWLAATLAMDGEVSPEGRVRALLAATDLARLQADHQQAQRLAEECLSVAQGLHDRRVTADALVRLGHVARSQNDYPRARTLFAESVALYRALDDKAGVRFALTMAGATAEGMGDYGGAQVFYQESLAVARVLDSIHDVAAALTGLGRVACEQGAPERARPLLEEALALQRRIADKNCSAHSLRGLGEVALAHGDAAAARRVLEQSLALYEEIDARSGVAAVHGLLGRAALLDGDTEQGMLFVAASLRTRCALSDRRGIAACLEDWAEVALALGHMRLALRLCAAARTLRHALGAPLGPAGRARYEQVLAAARERLEDQAARVAWDEGRTLPLEQIIAELLQEPGAVTRA